MGEPLKPPFKLPVRCEVDWTDEIVDADGCIVGKMVRGHFNGEWRSFGPYVVEACNAYPQLLARVAELEAERDEALADRNDWADAIRSVASGCIPSPHAARAAIEELKDKWDAALAEVHRLETEVQRLRQDNDDAAPRRPEV